MDERGFSIDSAAGAAVERSMKTLVLFFAIVLGLGSFYFGVMFLARQAGQEAGRAATKSAIAEYKRAREPSVADKEAQMESLNTLKNQVEALRNEAENGVETAVK